MEANKAIQMLEEEGSGVAFPEDFQQVREGMEQVREGMKRVQRLLESGDLAGVTQQAEKDIEDFLQKRIDALKKAQQQGKAGQPLLNSIGDKIDAAELPSFEKVFTDTNRQIHTREYAGRVLENHVATPTAKLAVRSIDALLDAREFKIRGQAALVLSKLGPRAAEAIPKLAQLLKEDGASQVRLCAARALEHLGKENVAEAVRALKLALRSENIPAVKAQAARALGAIGPKAEAAVPDLGYGLLEMDFARVVDLDDQGKQLVQATQIKQQRANEVSKLIPNERDSAKKQELIQEGLKLREEMAELDAHLKQVETELRTVLVTRCECAIALGRIGPARPRRSNH